MKTGMGETQDPFTFLPTPQLYDDDHLLTPGGGNGDDISMSHAPSDVTSAFRAPSDVTSATVTRELDAILMDSAEHAPQEVTSQADVLRREENSLLERASTLILTRAPTLSRAKSELLRDELDEIHKAQLQKDTSEIPKGAPTEPEVKPHPVPPQLQWRGPSAWYNDTSNQHSRHCHDSAESDDIISNDDDYDTDLDDAEDYGKVEVRTKSSRQRDFGCRTYLKSCEKLGVLPLSAVVRSLPGHVMNLMYCSLRSHETLAICNAMLDNRSVVELNLNGNNLGAKGADYIALLLSDNTRLKICSLAENGLGSVGGEAICESLLTNTSVTCINLSGNGFTDADAPYFADVIETNKYLRNVNLSHNAFGDKAAKRIGSAIGANDYIRSLDLSWNRFRPTGATAIARGLENNVSLKSLNLSMNGFSTQGAIAIGEALTQNVTLIDLDLTYNRIYDPAAASLAKGLAVNESLQYLYLANNPLTTNAALALLTGIKKNGTSAMRSLDMMNIFLSKEIMNCLESLRELRPHFIFQFAGMLGSSTDYGNAASMMGIRNYDPLIILMEFAAKKGLRVLEMFKQFDRDGSGSISRAEFVEGIKMFEIPVTDSQLDDLISQLDKDGDGEIDYGELLIGEKDYRKRLHKMKQKLTKAAKR